MKKLLSAAVLAAFAISGHATLIPTTTGSTTTLTEKFDGNTSFTVLTGTGSNRAHIGAYPGSGTYSGDDYLQVTAGSGGFDHRPQITFSTTAPASDLSIDFWYAHFSSQNVSGQVFFDGHPLVSLLQITHGDISAIGLINPGADSGPPTANSFDRQGSIDWHDSNFLHNVSAGTHTLEFSNCNGISGAACGSAWLKLDDLKIVINPVPEPETYAMLLVGLGVMGAVARRRKAQQA